MRDINELNLAESKRVVRPDLTKVINTGKLIVDEDGTLFIYNPRMEHYEGFENLEDIFSSAIHHRTFQQCI